MDQTGLGYQTRDLAYMLKPEFLMVIDSSYFNGNKQYPEWYESFPHLTTKGFPTIVECTTFLRHIDKMLTCETPYTYPLFFHANRMGIATADQYNWEFLDYLISPNLPKPSRFLAPSWWHFDDMKRRFKNTMYLPPATNVSEFSTIRNLNLARSGPLRILHVVGRQAAYDRNGTATIIEAMLKTKANIEVVIKAQSEIDVPDFNDHRINFDFSEPEERSDLYKDFDVMILPRRYGGLCMPMNEALISGLPVIMTDIEPNNRILPKEWLINARPAGTFQARTPIDIYAGDTGQLAMKIEWLAEMDSNELSNMKVQAFEIGHKNYSIDALRPQYTELLGH